LGKEFFKSCFWVIEFKKAQNPFSILSLIVFCPTSKFKTKF